MIILKTGLISSIAVISKYDKLAYMILPIICVNANKVKNGM